MVKIAKSPALQKESASNCLRICNQGAKFSCLTKRIKLEQVKAGGIRGTAISVQTDVA
jgi:hypothetical protein